VYTAAHLAQVGYNTHPSFNQDMQVATSALNCQSVAMSADAIMLL